MKKFMKGKEAFAAELIGTYFLVLCGTGAIAAESRFPGSGNGLGVALAFGLAVMVLVYTFGPLSGAHFNPAVSLGFFSVGKLKRDTLWIYLACQFAGATLASMTLKALLAPPLLGVTSSPLPPPQAWCLEVILTYLLVSVILGVTSSTKTLGSAAVGLAIGATITVDAIWGGPLTGASMNPARSFGPALVSGEFGQLWIYLSAPLVGGYLAALTYGLLRPSEA
jgi:MIP family channel proteins